MLPPALMSDCFKGVLQLSLIIHTFASHLASISLVPP
jgi:hypothetical protein